MSAKPALLALIATLAAFFGPMLLRGEVIYPHDNSLEMGAEPVEPRYRDDSKDRSAWADLLGPRVRPIVTRKFYDQSSQYVPEIHLHLHGDHRDWLETWNPHVEFGRPCFQFEAFSPSFLLTRIFHWFTDDAFQLYTWLLVSTLSLAALFGFFFLIALGLDPWAAYGASVLLALSYVSLYWQSAIMLPAGLCWTLGELWLIARWIERPSLARGIGIAFTTYALFMTAYPQQIVWHAYIAGAFALYWLWKHRAGGRVPWKSALRLAGWGALGFLAALPLYADLYIQAQSSARVDVDPEFFVALPEIKSWLDFGVFVAKIHDAFWLGNPIVPGYPGKFNWISLMPVFSTLVWLSWLEGGWKRAWLWHAFVVVSFIMTVWSGAYLFGVEHLGLSISRYVPLAAGLIPLMVVAGYTLDHVLRRGFAKPWLAAAIAAALPVGALCVRALAGERMHVAFVTVSLCFTLLLIEFIVRRERFWVPVLVAASTLFYASQLSLARTMDDIRTTSPLVERMRELLAGGLRYAFVDSGAFELLAPNHEERVGLSSVHSYNSLSPLIYQEFVKRLSEAGARTYGRQFRRIKNDSRLSQDEFSYCGIGLYISTHELTSDAVTLLGSVGPINLYAPSVAPVLSAQIDGVDIDATREVRLEGPLGAQHTLPMERVVAQDDYLHCKLTASDHDTVLFVSHQHHPQWRATSRGERLETVRINDFFQGVLVPPGTTEVELQFSPFVRWSFLAHWMFAIGAVIAIAIEIVRRRRVPL